MVIQLGFAVTLRCVIFFSTPPITFLMVLPSVLRVTLPVIARAIKSPPHGPGLQTFCSIHRPGGLQAIKSALNPGFGHGKLSLCPGAREGAFSWLMHNWNYHISKVVRAPWLVSLAGHTLLHGPLKLKVFLIAKMLRDLSPNFLNLT